VRLHPAPPPSRKELPGLSPHELVRDFAETLSVFRRLDVDLAGAGARPLHELEGVEAGSELLQALRSAMEWRSGAAS